MLTDPILVGTVSSSNLNAIQTDIGATTLLGQLQLRLVTQDGLASKRVCKDGDANVALSISHSESNENKPFVTRRTVVRLDRSVVNATTGTPVNMSAYIVMALPMGPDFDDAALVQHTRNLLFYLLFGQVDGASAVASSNEGNLLRIINLES